MRILVATNCQGGGIAAALSRIASLPEVAVTTLFMGDTYEQVCERLSPMVSGCDALLVVAGFAGFARRMVAERGPEGLRVMAIPSIEFDAFHPDLTYATFRASGALQHYYHSAIALWAFDRRIAPARAARLFCERTYRELGYLERWRPAVDRLRSNFEASDLGARFGEFFLAVKRLGCFMHTINHPRIEVLVLLAGLIARELGLELRSPFREGELTDALNMAIWPVYPEIGDALGIAGGGVGWRLDSGRVRIDGAEEFIRYSYRHYVTSGQRPGDVERFGFPVPDFDARMLRAARELL